jgi:hypothetical protein
MSSTKRFEEENRRLQIEVQRLKEELTQKNNLVLRLEAQIQTLVKGSNGGHVRSSTHSGLPTPPRGSSAGLPRQGLPPIAPPFRGERRDSDDVESSPPPPPKPRSGATSTSRSSPEHAFSSSLHPPSRSYVEMQQPLPVRPTTRHSAPLFNRQNLLESGIGTLLEGSIMEEEAEDDEEEEEEESEPVVSRRRVLQTAKGAIKALPRELSIFNSEDDDVTKYSIDDGMSTYELEKTEMRDAYNARGLYSGTVSRAEQMPHGRGRMEYHHQGRCYEGDWHMGHWHGAGMIRNAVGDVFNGQVVNDLKEGEGQMNFADGRVFHGRFIQDEAVEGTLIFPDGGKYVGEVHNGARHGHGVYWFVDGSKYEGQSVMNVFEGKGKMTWTDGGWFEGEWSRGEIHGYGTEIRADGSMRHKGTWSKGVPIRQ